MLRAVEGTSLKCLLGQKAAPETPEDREVKLAQLGFTGRKTAWRSQTQPG